MRNNKNNKIRVYIVDDHLIVCQAITALLNIDGFSVVGSSQRFDLDNLIELKPDVVIMDIRLFVDCGIDATKKIKDKNPEIKVLILSGYISESLLASAIRAGASGYLTKTTNRKILADAIKDIFVTPSFYIDKAFMETYENVREKLKINLNGYSLTNREKDVLAHIVSEKSTKEIALELCISEKTVRNHKSNIMQKLGLKSDVGLTKHAYSMALI